MVEVGIGADVYKTPMVVSAREEKPNIIIGADFLVAHNCDLLLRQKLGTIGEHKFECIPEQVKASVTRRATTTH